MRERGFWTVLAAPLVLWGVFHFAGPRLWTVAFIMAAMLSAWWRDANSPDRRVTRPILAWFIPALAWCLVSTAAGFAGWGDPKWWLLPVILAPVTLWLWVAVVAWWPRVETDDPEPEPEPEPEEAPRRTLYVVDRTPPPEPLVTVPPRVVTLHQRPVMVDLGGDDEPDEEGEGGVDEALPGRLERVWPERRKTPKGAVHVADLAGLTGVPEDELGAALDAAGKAERVSARPLAGGAPSSEKGLRWAALQAWVCATSCATPGEGCDLHG